jgi:hypothetical protein
MKGFTVYTPLPTLQYRFHTPPKDAMQVKEENITIKGEKKKD